MGKQYSKQELCDGIYQAVLQAGKPITRRDICDALGLTKAAHVIAMIQGLSTQKWLIETAGTDKHGRAAYFYTIGQQPKTLDCADVVEIGVDRKA